MAAGATDIESITPAKIESCGPEADGLANESFAITEQAQNGTAFDRARLINHKAK